MNINGLAHEINRQLAIFAGVCQESVDKAANNVAVLGVAKLRLLSPKGATGDYAEGWRVKKEGKKRIIHNATRYRLTHLLEKGHATIDGGRTEAQPHIKPVEQQLETEFLEQVKNGIENYG